MNLKDFLSNKGKPPELYWSLVLEEGWVQAGIWYIDSSVANVVGTSHATAWETQDELVGATDTALSTAVQKIPEDYPEPNKTVFGVPSSWVKNGEINEDHLKIIKKLCVDLSLTPVGFVVLPEAVAHLYKSEEGTPVNAIIMGLSKDNLEISVFSLGNLVGTTQVARSVSLVDDVSEGLSRFEGANPLPSRFILFDGKGGELEEAKDQLLKHNWDTNDKVKFLHTPKAEILISERKVLATSLAGANEIGDVLKVAKYEEKAEELPTPLAFVPEDDNLREVNEVTPEDLGFSIDTDVSLNKKEEVNIVKEFEKPPVNMQGALPTHQPPKVVPIAHPRQKFNFKESFLRFKTKIGSTLKRLTFSLKVNTSHTKGPKPAILIAIVLLFIGGGVYWWFVPTAKVNITIKPQTFQEEAEVVFNTDGQTDLSTGIVAAKMIESKVSGGKTKAATGSKLIGDKAKGTVQIQNGTAFPINLTAGTILISSGNLKFDLDQAASVSAALSPTSPGTASLAVTANSIGAEYNLAKSEVFKVGNYPKAEVDATSISDFAGGSSRQISAVSKVDIETLETQLKEELSSKAKDSLLVKVEESQILVSDFVSSEVSQANFDHKLGEEADNVTLNMELSANTLAADKLKLFEFAKNLLKDKTPNGFVLRDAQIKFEFGFIEQTDNNYKYQVKVTGNFLPNLDEPKIKRDIAGKSQTAVRSYLGSHVAGFVDVHMNINPPYPIIFKTLPRVLDHIEIVSGSDD